jgi:D-alanine transaminase
MISWFCGEYLPDEEIHILPSDRGFLFADALYEFVLCYEGGFFRIKEHLARLHRGADQLRFPQTDFAFMEEVAEELRRKNGLEKSMATVYIQVSRGAVPKRGHGFPPSDTPMTMYMSINAFDPAQVIEKREKGIGLYTVSDNRWARCDMKTTSLTANILACEYAESKGGGEALFVKDGVLIEGSHSNFAGICDGTLVTHPDCNRILPGISKAVVLELAAANGIPVEERPIFQAEQDKFSEFMVLGTTVEVTPVIAIDGRPIGDGKPGKMVRRLQGLYADYVKKVL